MTATHRAPLTSRAVETEIGLVRIDVDADEDAIVAIEFSTRAPVDAARPSPLLDDAARQLRAYFSEKSFRFDLPLAPSGTDFQKRVWQRLRGIEPGTTTSYGALAQELGTKARAVGTANGSNPVAIVVPCHRVIGASGSLTGYGGGLHRKRWLLVHEGALLT